MKENIDQRNVMNYFHKDSSEFKYHKAMKIVVYSF